MGRRRRIASVTVRPRVTSVTGRLSITIDDSRSVCSPIGSASQRPTADSQSPRVRAKSGLVALAPLSHRASPHDSRAVEHPLGPRQAGLARDPVGVRHDQRGVDVGVGQGLASCHRAEHHPRRGRLGLLVRRGARSMLRRIASMIDACRLPIWDAGMPLRPSSTRLGPRSWIALRSASRSSASSIRPRTCRGLRISADAKSTARMMPCGVPRESTITRWCTPCAIIREKAAACEKSSLMVIAGKAGQLADRRGHRDLARRHPPAEVGVGHHAPRRVGPDQRRGVVALGHPPRHHGHRLVVLGRDQRAHQRARRPWACGRGCRIR